jgi:hypothetical protein
MVLRLMLLKDVKKGDRDREITLKVKVLRFGRDATAMAS